MQEGLFIHKKEVDWSLLHQGLTIPVSIQVVLKQLIRDNLPRGTTRNIKIILDNNSYPVKLINQKFNVTKYPTHRDIIQIRYEPNHEIAKQLRSRFFELYNYMIKHRNVNNNDNSKVFVPIPEDMRQYVILYSTAFDDTFLFDYITSAESKTINTSIGLLTEEEFEVSSNCSRIDLEANIYKKTKLVKIRKLDRSICDNLKLLYNYRCQISGERFGEQYNSDVSEAHHIDYFTKSLNNNSDNIIIVSPNFHRLIHKTNPSFDRNKLTFLFPNGTKEKLKLNLHLLNDIKTGL
jgi:5-methylcytosine-specific restriction enzyme A